MTFQQIIEYAKTGSQKKIAVVAADDADVLLAVNEAKSQGIAEPVLIGDARKIKAIAGEQGFDLLDCVYIDEEDHAAAAKKGVELAAAGEVDAIMKGQLHSAVLMRAILNKEWGIRMSGVLSHVGIIQSPKVGRPLFLTDGAMCTYPDLKQKVDIIKNAVAIARRLGVECPRVACLAALETVNPDMPPTLDAAALALMSQRGQFSNCVVDGPLALDNAVDLAAAQHKGVKSPTDVVGRADILLVPNIEAGNLLLKASRHLADCSTVGLLAGARVPVVMSSRADTAQNKLCAIACAVCSTQ